MRTRLFLPPALICVALAGCATGEHAGVADLARALPRHPVTLLGEVHDNALHRCHK